MNRSSAERGRRRLLLKAGRGAGSPLPQSASGPAAAATLRRWPPPAEVYGALVSPWSPGWSSRPRRRRSPRCRSRSLRSYLSGRPAEGAVHTAAGFLLHENLVILVVAADAQAHVQFICIRKSGRQPQGGARRRRAPASGLAQLIILARSCECHAMGEGPRALVTRPLYYCAWSCPQLQSERNTQSAAKLVRKYKRCGPLCSLCRAPPAPAPKTQVSSTCTALSLPAVSSAGRRGQLRIRKRITTASSSRNFVDSRARPAPVATPDRRRGLSQTNARRSPPRTGCCPRARSSPARRRCCRRARPCLNRPLLAAAARASRVAMPAQALKDGEEAAEEIFQQDESVRSLDSRKNRRV